MKYLLNGVVVAAALAIAAPVWAQAPAAAPGAAPAAAPPAAGAPMAAKPAMQKHRPMRHAGGHHKMMKKGAGDQMTEQLNREELARISGGAAPAMPAAPPQAFQGPKASGGAKPPQ
jgi:hypothetical protein